MSGNLSQSLFTSSGAAGGSFGVSATGGGQNPPLTTSSFSFTGVTAAVTLTSANVSSVIERARLSGLSANFERLLAPPPDTNVGVGETLTINSGESLTNEATFNNLGNVFNNGSLINNGILDNSGVFSNAGVVTNFHDINNLIGSLFSNGEFGTLINDNGGTITNDGALINSGALDNSNGATLVNNNALTSIIGTLTNDGDVLNNGQLRVANVFGTIPQSGTVVNNTSLVNSGTLFVEKGTLTNNDTLINDGGAVRVFQDGVIDGSGTLTQEYDGFLQIDGTVEQSVVLNSGVLQGTGNIIGDVFVGEGATVAPGFSPGTLFIDGKLDVAAGAIIQLEFGDVLNVTGTVDIALGAIVELIFGSVAPPSVADAPIDLADFFDVVNPTDINFLATDISVFFDGGDGSFETSVNAFGSIQAVSVENSANASSVPEPGTLALLGIGLAGLSYLRGRRKAA